MVCFRRSRMANGNPCFVNGVALGSPCSDLLPFDLTRGGGLFGFRGHTDVKQLALYIQDQITKGNWSFNVGLRGDFYNGLTTHKEAEPRLGLAYNIKRTQHRPSPFVCESAGDAVQRESDRRQRGMRQSSLKPAARLCFVQFNSVEPRLAQ